jgi:hypothetical protein
VSVVWTPVRAYGSRGHVVYWDARSQGVRVAVRSSRYDDNGLFEATLYTGDRAEDRQRLGSFPTRQQAQEAAEAALAGVVVSDDQQEPSA